MLKPATELLQATERLRRSIRILWSSHRRRPRVEAEMRCRKRLGDHTMAQDFDRQTTEPRIRVVVLDRSARLHAPETQRAA